MQSPLTDDEVANVARPIETAIGLPNRAYTDEAFLDAEREQILARRWIAVAFAHDVPAPGDLFPATAAGQPLLVVRDTDDSVRVFHNVCRHRGTRLVDVPCRSRNRIVCPYHGWTYGLDGALRATPNFSGPGDHSHASLAEGTQDLVEVPSGVWNHVVMVNLSGDATSLRGWTARLDRRWAEFDIADMAPGWSMTFDIGANWKLVVENFLESYHLPVVHPGLNAYSPLEDHDLVVDEVFMGQLSLNYAPRDGGNALPRFAGLSGARATSGEYLLLFPSLMVSITPDHFRATIVTPVSADRSHQRWEFFFVGPESAAERFRAAREAVAHRVAAYTREDVAILEKLQSGRRSNGYDGGRFSPFHETTTHWFQTLIARALHGPSREAAQPLLRTSHR